MIVRVEVFSGLVKTKSHRVLTTSAWREDCSRYRCDLMGVGVIVPVEFIVDHIVDTGCGHLVARLEYFIIVGHVGVLPAVIRV